jgi:hypothetical protein
MSIWNWVKENTLWAIIITSAIFTIGLGTIGFWNQSNHCNGFYEVIRLLVINHQFEINENIDCCVQIARYLGVVTFVLFSFRVFLLLIPNWWTKKVISGFWIFEKGFRKHYVIFGQDELCMALIRKISNERKKLVQIVYIIDKDLSKEDYKKYQSNTLKIIEGNPLKGKKDTAKVFDDANLIKASKFFAVCLEDSQNVEIAKNVWEYLTNHPETRKRKGIKEKIKLPESEREKLSIEESTTALRCYTLVKDNDFKNIIEESPIFKYERKDKEVFYFDGVVFNNVGVQYGVNMIINEILPEKWEDSTNILIVGYDDFAVAIMLHLSHVLTKKHDTLKFHIITNDESAENHFKRKYGYLYDFAEITFYRDFEKFDLEKMSSIFVCNNDNSKAVSVAVAIRYKLQKDKPCIFILTRNPNYLEEVFNVRNTEKPNEVLTFNRHNIKLFRTLDYFWDLVINHRDEIENNAKQIHAQYEITNKIGRYEYLTETYKQSNRNAALDFYIKTYILSGNNFDDFRKSDKLIEFTPKEKEYLAEIEHRRWMLEKFYDGWTYGKERKNQYKIHTDLVSWDKLSAKSKYNNFNSVHLLLQTIKENNENLQPPTA